MASCLTIMSTTSSCLHLSSSSSWEVWASGNAWIHAMAYVNKSWSKKKSAKLRGSPTTLGNSFVSIPVFQFIHLKSFISIQSFQFIHFNSFISILSFNPSFIRSFIPSFQFSFQFLHVNSFISTPSCQFFHFNFFISSHSLQFVHFNAFISCISFHFRSSLSNSSRIPISHVPFSKLLPRRVPDCPACAGLDPGRSTFSQQTCKMAMCWRNRMPCWTIKWATVAYFPRNVFGPQVTMAFKTKLLIHDLDDLGYPHDSWSTWKVVVHERCATDIQGLVSAHPRLGTILGT